MGFIFLSDLYSHPYVLPYLFLPNWPIFMAAAWTMQELFQRPGTRLLFDSLERDPVRFWESGILYLKIAMYGMSCYFRRVWLGNMWSTWTSHLQDTHHRSWGNRASLTVLCCVLQSSNILMLCTGRCKWEKKAKPIQDKGNYTGGRQVHARSSQKESDYSR